MRTPTPALHADAILRLRLANQHLATPARCEPARLVAHFAAVQSQDLPAARWAVAQRLPAATDTTIDASFARGQILRTHVLRPTWHFVAPEDIRWLLALTAPRVKAAMASRDRVLGIDDAVVSHSNAVFAQALAGGRQLTRPELGAALRQAAQADLAGLAGLDVSDGGVFGHLLVRAELDAVICSGPLRGKQVTYALLDERVAPAARLDRDQALAELVRRYFTSHGPATVRDFCWWSGLTTADARRGLDLNGARLERVECDGLTYWFAPSDAPLPPAESVWLLPNFDEYTVAYRDRDLFYAPSPTWRLEPRQQVPFGNVIVSGGRVAGVWKRTLRTDAVAIDARWFAEPGAAQRCALTSAAERYAAFIGLPLRLATA